MTGSPWLSRRTRPLVPHDDSRCGWLQGVEALTPAPPLAGDVEADAVVVGAGFTGLAVARAFTEAAPGRRVLLLEAQTAGFGASGRASGFVVDLAHFVARMAPEAAEAYIRLARAGIAELRQRVHEEGIPCDWDDRGWLHVAWGEEGARSVAKLRGWLEGRGEDHLWLERDELAEVTGVPFYRAGIRLPGSVLVQSGALVRGLAARLPSSVERHDRTPVLQLERQGSRWLITTPGGRVKSELVFLAVNGYTRRLGRLARRVLPLATFGSLSRPLSEREQEALGGEREWGVLAEDAMGSTVRRTRDQRILIRNSVAYSPRLAYSAAALAEAREAHRQAFAARFPMLGDVAFESTWAGVMGVSPSRSPLFGEVAPGAFYTGGFTGAGIAMGAVLGRLLVDLALGRSSSCLEDALALPGPTELPPEPFLSLGARFETWRMKRQAGPVV